jgi:hypothetical protein
MMSFSKTFTLQDDGSFVQSFNLERQQLTMTPRVTEVCFFTLLESLEVVHLLG